MSHQHSFQRMSDDAVDFALAAKESAGKVGVRALTAEAATMAAQAYAQRGEHNSSLRELQRAEAEFCRIRPGETPDWLSYFDEAYLSAKFAHSLKELGESREAAKFARRSLNMTAGYERGRMFNTALLASVVADQGEVEEATEQAVEAISLARNVRSTRSAIYLSDVAERLRRYSDHADVQRLYKLMNREEIPLRRV